MRRNVEHQRKRGGVGHVLPQKVAFVDGTAFFFVIFCTSTLEVDFEQILPVLLDGTDTCRASGH